MIKAVWVSDNELSVEDEGKTVAKGQLTQSNGKWYIEQPEATPALDSAYGDFLVRLLVRRAYEMGAYEQYVNAAPEMMGFYTKLGFEPEHAHILPSGVLMKHVGDVRGYC
jgi:N-acetylglutamate synthase-like GNAT family acetyltransferase